MATEGNYIPPITDGTGAGSSRGGGVRGRKRSNFHRNNSWRKRAKLVNPNRSLQVVPPISASNASDPSQRNELFTAPISTDLNQLQVFHINNPLQYPGWRLYFPTEMFIESSPLVKKIKAFELHITNNPGVYTLDHIREQQWFFVNKENLAKDNNFNLSWNDFMQELLERPNIVLACLGLAVHNAIHSISAQRQSQHKQCIRRIEVRPVNFFPITSIAEISPEKHDRLLVVYGRIVWMSAVETKCTWVAYKCKRCSHEQAIRQDIYPTKPLRCRIQCNSKRSFKELRSSPYTRVECVQMVQLQETGSNQEIDSSHRIEIELRGDLIDLVCPGNEVTVTGVLKYKSLTRSQEHRKQPERVAFIQAVTVINRTKSGTANNSQKATQKDLEIVEMISKEPNCLRLLVQSLAPDICGYETIKFAVLLSQIGGYGSQLHDEGELHILVVGDPGLGKSNLLQHAARISEIGKSHTSFMSAIQQTNRSTGSSTPNLLETPSVFSFHAGQCCIDDMDKLSSSQETLIQIMQTRSVTTRSTNVAFNTAAKKSILAAVNPAGGHYDSSKLLRENVRLKPSLLSLFHFVFVLFDEVNKDRDNLLAEHVKAMHSGMKKILTIPKKFSRNLKESDLPLQNDEVDLVDRLKVNCDEQLDLLPPILLKKYIAYAQQNINPLLTKEAAEDIKEFYLGLRSDKRESDFSITTRQLEGLIRFTQARARAELSLGATKKHASDVIELVRNSYTQTPITSRLDSSLNGSIVGKAGGNQVKKFVQMVQIRSNVLGKRIFEFEELSDMASHAGIKCGVTNILELMNMQGYLLKKGPKLYEVTLTP